MLSAKRQSRWERAWVAAGLVCCVLFLPVLSSAQADGTGSQNQTPPAATPTAVPSQGLPQPTPAPAADQSQDTAQSQDGTANPDSANAEVDQLSSTQPVPTNLQTGLPLRSVMSPLHWGHLSLLSFQGVEIYDTNYQPQQQLVARQLTALQGLFVYSIQKARSSLNLQYCPFVWFSQNQTYKDFTANALDLSTSHIFNRRWSLSASDNFQYSPNLANTLQSAFAADFVSSTSSQTAFLSAGRKALFNNANIGVTAQLSQTSHLTFDLSDEYVRLGSYVGSLNTTVPNLSETMNYYGGGVTWGQQLNPRTSVSLGYTYRRQSLSGFGADTSYNAVSAGFSRILKPGLTFSAEAGPGWSDSASLLNGTQKQRRTTVQGMAQLFKAFRNGGVALSFYRTSEFSGVISNSYSNRYDLSISRRLATRWNVAVSGSYIQQEYVGVQRSTGDLAWAELGYMLSRNWSAFTGYRYLDIARNQVWSGPQQLVTAGIRWAWQPEHK